MPLQRRLPKVGFRSKITPLVAEVRLNELALVAGGVIDLDALKKAGVVPANAERATRHAVRRDQDRRDREGRRRHQGRARGDRSRRRHGRGRLSGPTRQGSQVANPLSSNPVAALGEAGRFTELRRRFFFLLGGLIVYRIGTFIPVPGIDPVALARFFQDQQGTILSMFNMFSGGALQRLSIFAMGVMPYISASIIVQMMAVVVPPLQALRKEGESGRRKLTQYTRYGTVGLAAFQGAGAAVAFQNQGVVLEPGPAVRVHGHDHAGRGHDVPDVARRADHRARPRQRHLDDHPRGHRRGPAGRDRRHARAGAQRRDQPGACADPGADGRRGHGLRRVRRARASAASRSTTRSASRGAACSRARPRTCRSSSTCRA